MLTKTQYVIFLTRKDYRMSSKMGAKLKQFTQLIKAVRQDHEAKNALLGGGHGFDHAYVAAHYCLEIAKEPLATLAFVAAICHNTDRHYGDDMVRGMMNRYLAYTDFSGQDKLLVAEAVLNHSNRPSANDNPVTVVLMDSDKLTILSLSGIIGAGQFRPNLPILDLRYPDLSCPPGTNYKNPGSIARDMMGWLEWGEEGWIRTPEAKELAKPKFQKIRQFLDNLILEITDVGLLEYPFKEDFAS